MLVKEGVDAVGGMAIGIEEANEFARKKREGFIVHLKLARLGKIKVRHDSFQTAASRVILDGKTQFAIPLLHPEVEQKGEQPIARKRIIVERENALDASEVIRAGREVGAEKQMVVRAHEGGESRQNVLRFEVRDHAEEGDEPRGMSVGVLIEDGGEIISSGEIANQRMAILIGNSRQRRRARDEYHGRADIRGSVSNMLSSLPQQVEKARVFLAAATTKADQMDRIRSEAWRGGGEAGVVNRGAIGIGARGGIGLVEGKPFLGLFDAVVMELVVDLARAEGLKQIVADGFGKLAGMDGHMGNGRHARLLPQPDGEHKPPANDPRRPSDQAHLFASLR